MSTFTIFSFFMNRVKLQDIITVAVSVGRKICFDSYNIMDIIMSCFCFVNFCYLLAISGSKLFRL